MKTNVNICMALKDNYTVFECYFRQNLSKNSIHLEKCLGGMWPTKSNAKYKFMEARSLQINMTNTRMVSNVDSFIAYKACRTNDVSVQAGGPLN